MTLKELRLAKRYTQVFVAKKLNVDQAAVSHWENGKNPPTKKYFKKIAKLYECDETDIEKAINKN